MGVNGVRMSMYLLTDTIFRSRQRSKRRPREREEIVSVKACVLVSEFFASRDNNGLLQKSYHLLQKKSYHHNSIQQSHDGLLDETLYFFFLLTRIISISQRH